MLNCLISFQNQTYKSFCVTIVDDASGIPLTDVLNIDWQFQLNFIVNKENLGAVPNMLHCMQLPSSCPYILVFHEDDLAHPDYLLIAYNAFSRYPEATLFCSNMSFFKNADEFSFDSENKVNTRMVSEPKFLVEKILKGAAISFTSCIYSKYKLDERIFDLERFSMLADRPFILNNLISGDTLLYSDANLIAAQDHTSAIDSRWRDLRTEHIFNLFTFYKSFFNYSTDYDKIILKKYLTRLVWQSYFLLDPKYRPNLLSYLAKNLFKNNLSLPYLLLLNPTIRNIKKYFSYN